MKDFITRMRPFIIIIMLILAKQVNAQTKFPQKLRISSGRCGSPCGYEKGFHDIIFIQQLEYALADSSFKFRHKTNKEFKKLNNISSPNFADPKLYSSLDSLFEKFEDFEASPGKYFIYKFELIYCTSREGLPSKTKTMEFWVSTNPKKIHPSFIDTLIDEYIKIVYKNAP